MYWKKLRSSNKLLLACMYFFFFCFFYIEIKTTVLPLNQDMTRQLLRPKSPKSNYYRNRLSKSQLLMGLLCCQQVHCHHGNVLNHPYWENTHGGELLASFWGCRHSEATQRHPPQRSLTDHTHPIVKPLRTTKVFFEATRLAAQLEQTSLRESFGCKCSWHSIKHTWLRSFYHLVLYFRLSEG